MNTGIAERVRALLHVQAESLDPPEVDPARFTTGSISEATPRARRARFVGAAVVAAAATVVGIVLVKQVIDDQRTQVVAPAAGDASGGSGTDDAPKLFEFETSTVRFGADAVRVEADGKEFVPTDTEARSDPGTWQEYTTLELTWLQHGSEMRIYVYFASDGIDWWASEIRTFDGTEQPDWDKQKGEFFRTPLGQPFEGDVDLGPLHVEAMTLEAFISPTACDDADQQFVLDAPVDEINGVFLDGMSGYGLGLSVLDTTTCTPVNPDEYDYQVSSANLGIAEVTSLPEVRMDRVVTQLTFNGIGQTAVRVTALSPDTGEVVDEIEVSIVVQAPSGPDHQPPTTAPVEAIDEEEG